MKGADTRDFLAATKLTMMLIPVEVEKPEIFIGRVRTTLADQRTHIYVDTSFLMWLTAVGSSSRAVFFDWASTLNDRIHVPTWAAHEYYRHHQRRTQKNEITEKCSAVEKAIKDLKAHMRVYADGSLIAERPEMTFVQDLDAAAEHIQNAVNIAQNWDYDSAAVKVIKWINDHPLATTKTFEDFANLKRSGSARYGHEVPPGFEDGHKRVNRFGDLIFWEDVIADASARNVNTVIVLTRDRKKDWFFSGLESEPSEDLRRLKGTWNPVPVAHPMLSLEMRTRVGAELILIDELYLGGVMWLTDMRRFGRLAAVTFGMSLARLEGAMRAPPGIAERAAKRDATQTIGYADANRIIQAARANEDRPAVLEMMARLNLEAPQVDAAIEAVTAESLDAMSNEDLTVLSKRLFESALIGPSAEATLAKRLLDAVDKLNAPHASAVIGGMLFAAYVENGVPRSTPTGQLLQELLEWRVDRAVSRVVEACAREFRRLRSPAIYLPSISITPIDVRIDASPSNTRTPVAIGQIYIGPQALLIDTFIDPRLSLSVILNNAEVANVKDVVSAVGRHFGVPLGQLRIVGAEESEARTILSTTGLERFDPLKLPARALEQRPTGPAATEPALEVDVAAPSGEGLNTVGTAPTAHRGHAEEVEGGRDDVEADDDELSDEEDLP